jgi:membrane-associated protein
VVVDLGVIFQQVINLTGSFNTGLILAIFLLTLISEFGFSPPYLIESIWLFVGYHIAKGMITPEFIVLFFLTSLVGRQVGAFTLYKLSGFGSTPFTRLYNRIIDSRLKEREMENWFRRLALNPIANLIAKNFAPYTPKKGSDTSDSSTKMVKARHLSTINVALGRFIWLKIPLTITMGITRQLIALVAGVTLFSLAWDGLYISLGIFGNGNGLNPMLMLLYTFGGFVVVNLTIILIKRRFSSSQPTTALE